MLISVFLVWCETFVNIDVPSIWVQHPCMANSTWTSYDVLKCSIYAVHQKHLILWLMATYYHPPGWKELLSLTQYGGRKSIFLCCAATHSLTVLSQSKLTLSHTIAESVKSGLTKYLSFSGIRSLWSESQPREVVCCRAQCVGFSEMAAHCRPRTLTAQDFYLICSRERFLEKFRADSWTCSWSPCLPKLEAHAWCFQLAEGYTPVCSIWGHSSTV